ncbi:cytochrome c-type biogenesis protein H1 [Salmonella enterica subsp. enterica serovar Typhimurium str. DT104]|uniref:TPR domain-containing protein n=1 Tax=Salmonella enterica TaxID=28901 RepID=UPI0005E99161|nr:tail fiber protein [Salmonella enterica]CQA73777.1 cytochrome c-type biogenesis protein H1 [Salmonella enterica subsp. enterica serovar Typhimurium str. DT104]CQK33686.1 cytochrome c-type biogenesis protein H1 [Salmonella enterica subsp. enterica serovar Typhimurium str. DT104]CQP50755.1 cytochrome c-type biogenesis protein H1 [Salmonella enterica subsp. enterica serovar Typhimurium str. DT104]
MISLEDASLTKKGIVKLSSATDSDSEALAATPKAVKTVMGEVRTKAPLDSPAFTGTPTTPTPPGDAKGLQTTNAEFVRKLIAALVGSVLEPLDTLQELADALGNDPNFATTVLNKLAGKQPLNEEEMARLALGLRTRLQNDAGNVEGWLILGRTGMVLGNAGTATGAYANAYRLDPKNRDAALGYAEALTRSSDPEDNRRGGELLRRLVSRDHTDIRVLSLYAFNAFEQQRFGEAVAAWEMMLKLLPAGDARRAVIERSIRLAQEK